MVKTLTAALQDHLDGGVTTLCTLWTLTRRDGIQLGFTDADSDIVYDGLLHVAATGYTRTALSANAALSVDNMDLEGLLSSGALTADDIRAGLYDWSELLVRVINYADLAQGAVILRRGWLGEFTLRGGIYVTELRGLTQALSRNFIESTTPTCRADLGDERCKVDMTLHRETGTVDTVSTQRRIFDATITGTRAAGYFDGGELTWLSGENTGAKQEVKIVVGTAVELYLPSGRDLTVGDTFQIQAGCDKLLSTCIAKFDNVLNFRGEPWIPGLDSINQSPDAKPPQ